MIFIFSDDNSSGRSAISLYLAQNC